MLLPQIIAPLNAKMPERPHAKKTERLIMLLAGAVSAQADNPATTESVKRRLRVALINIHSMIVLSFAKDREANPANDMEKLITLLVKIINVPAAKPVKPVIAKAAVIMHTRLPTAPYYAKTPVLFPVPKTIRHYMKAAAQAIVPPVRPVTVTASVKAAALPVAETLAILHRKKDIAVDTASVVIVVHHIGMTPTVNAFME